MEASGPSSGFLSPSRGSSGPSGGWRRRWRGGGLSSAQVDGGGAEHLVLVVLVLLTAVRDVHRVQVWVQLKHRHIHTCVRRTGPSAVRYIC